MIDRKFDFFSSQAKQNHQKSLSQASLFKAAPSRSCWDERTKKYIAKNEHTATKIGVNHLLKSHINTLALSYMTHKYVDSYIETNTKTNYSFEAPIYSEMHHLEPTGKNN